MDAWGRELAGVGWAVSGAWGLAAGDPIKATEGAALAMLAVMAVVVGLLGWFVWTLVRRSRRPDPTLRFLDGLQSDSPPRGRAPEPSRPRDAGGAAWERPADWWKE